MLRAQASHLRDVIEECDFALIRDRIWAKSKRWPVYADSFTTIPLNETGEHTCLAMKRAGDVKERKLSRTLSKFAHFQNHYYPGCHMALWAKPSSLACSEQLLRMKILQNLREDRMQ